MKYLVFLIFILSVSCSNDASRSTETEKVEKDGVEKISSRTSDEVSQSTLTSSNWQIEIVLDNGKIEDKSDWKGSTVYFNGDGSYVWKGEKMEEKGKFELDVAKSMIFLNANSIDAKSEWSIKYRGSMMVWIGTPKYGHHALQIKLNQKSKEQ
jgi:hypothetical protein